jgi:predicted membrane protein
MDSGNALRITPKLLFGLGVMALGLLWTLDNLDILESERITIWWPVVLILIGLVKLFDVRGGRGAGIVLTLVGTVILLGNLDIVHWNVFDLIPLIIAGVGAKLVWDALVRRRDRAAADHDPGSNVSAFAMMAGIKRRNISTSFHGGDVNAIMGGVELDLRDAKILPGQEAVLDTFAFWGGIEITVPHDWRVVGQVMPLMGGFVDNTVSNGSGPVLIVRGAAVMGAVELKNPVDAPAPR